MLVKLYGNNVNNYNFEFIQFYMVYRWFDSKKKYVDD